MSGFLKWYEDMFDQIITDRKFWIACQILFGLGLILEFFHGPTEDVFMPHWLYVIANVFFFGLSSFVLIFWRKTERIEPQ